MANLVSPGVSVTITDESFFIPAAAPTVPLLFVATAEEKVQPDGISPAVGTYEHDVVRTVTSLSQSLQLYGVPRFLEDFQGNQHHGDARNEYGLFALNQFLGAGNRAFVVRANVNLNDNLDDIRTSWTSKMNDAGFVLQNLVQAYMDEYNVANGLIVGSPGYKTTVTSSELISLAHQATADVWDSFTFANLETDFFDDNTNPATASAAYQLVDVGGNIADTAGYQVVDFVAVEVGTNLHNLGTNTYDFTITVDGGAAQPISVATVTGGTLQDVIDTINLAMTGATAALNVGGDLVFTSATTGVSSTILLADGTTLPFFSALHAVHPLTGGYPSGILTPVPGAVGGTPTGLMNDATVYTATINVDGTNKAITVTGSAAQTYISLINEINTDLAGAATVTTTAGNLKVTSAITGSGGSVIITDVDLFSSLTQYVSLGTPIGGVDADALMPVYENGYALASTNDFYGLEGMIADCVLQGYCPTVANEFTALESKDVLLDAADLFAYTVEFLNKTSLGANDAARRVAIVTALQATINSNTDIRAETLEYNLILCPGYHETVDEMKALSDDIEQEAMVIADTPMSMNADDVVTWADTNSERQHGENVAYYYPHGIASNLDGKNVYVAASGVALRTITFSDNVSDLWFAPAGTRRGLVSGVAQVGYVSGTLGTATKFNEIALNKGQRDNLYKYTTNINPIVFFPGRGILIWGQKTSASAASARDRINVERMLMYIKRQLRKNTLPFLFQPNDQLTRNNLKAAVDGFLGDIMAKRGLYDFATVCDDSNNTPDRIDRNEMYIDVALKPTKAAEFLYIPIRVVATGAELF